MKDNINSKAIWIVSILFFCNIFFQCICFHIETYHSLLISSIVSRPLFFWSFWLPKLSVCLLLASFCLLFRSHYASIVFSFLLSIWILANLMYVKTNSTPLNAYAFTMVGNMDGFWSSCLALVEWSNLLPLFSSVLYTFLCIRLDRKIGYPVIKAGSILVIVTAILSCLSMSLVSYKGARVLNGNSPEILKQLSFADFIFENPYARTKRNELKTMQADYQFYDYSVIHGALFDLIEYIDLKYQQNHAEPLTDEEKNTVNALLQGDNKVLHYDAPLIIILVESLEDWAVNPTIMPCLTNFIASHPVLHAKVKSQIGGGISSDGQLIINTGLLPVKEGAVCFRYPYNTLPSLVTDVDSSVIIVPHGLSVWNQRDMSNAYGFSVSHVAEPSDSVIFSTLLDYVRRGYRTIEAVTLRSHLPFEAAHLSHLALPADMPDLMARYAKTIHMADEGLNVFLQQIDTLPELSDATIVITGDHTIFWDIRNSFEAYCNKKGLNFHPSEAVSPLIIYTPSIDSTIVPADSYYQMDIYSTVLPLLSDDYYWKGLGVNILSTDTRWLSPEYGRTLSDKMFALDYFSNIVHQ